MTVNWKEDIAIDENSLIYECQRHQGLVIKYGELLIDAESILSTITSQLAAVRARAYIEIKKSPCKFGWDDDKSPNVDWVKAMTEIHDDVVAKNDELLKATKNVKMLKVITYALNDRRRNLSNIVQLVLGGINSQDVMTRAEKKVTNKRSEDFSNEQRDGLNRIRQERWGKRQ